MCDLLLGQPRSSQAGPTWCRRSSRHRSAWHPVTCNVTCILAYLQSTAAVCCQSPTAKYSQLESYKHRTWTDQTSSCVVKLLQGLKALQHSFVSNTQHAAFGHLVYILHDILHVDALCRISMCLDSCAAGCIRRYSRLLIRVIYYMRKD